MIKNMFTPIFCISMCFYAFQAHGYSKWVGGNCIFTCFTIGSGGISCMEPFDANSSSTGITPGCHTSGIGLEACYAAAQNACGENNFGIDYTPTYPLQEAEIAEVEVDGQVYTGAEAVEVLQSIGAVKPDDIGPFDKKNQR